MKYAAPAVTTSPLCRAGATFAPEAPAYGALFRLIQWSDSMLPVGGFAFSCALESAVQAGVVRDETTLREFTLTALRQSAHSDLIALAHAHRAALQGDDDALAALDKAVYARKLAEENRTMSLRMGRKLLDLATALLDGAPAPDAPAPDVNTAPGSVAPETLRRFAAAVREGIVHGVYGTWPVAQGLVFAAVGLGREQALAAHQYGVAATMLNAALRLLRVTHVQTQRVLYHLAEDVEAQCRHAATATPEQMCTFAPMTDILGAAHVRAHVRLFMG